MTPAVAAALLIFDISIIGSLGGISVFRFIRKFWARRKLRALLDRYPELFRPLLNSWMQPLEWHDISKMLLHCSVCVDLETTGQISRDTEITLEDHLCAALVGKALYLALRSDRKHNWSPATIERIYKIKHTQDYNAYLAAALRTRHY